jgi:hypothetical protein
MNWMGIRGIAVASRSQETMLLPHALPALMWRGTAAALALAVFASMANAATINAASCTPTAVRSALSQAQAGDIVRIPAGTCGWNETISWSAPPNVSVLGAGDLNVQGGGNATIIVDDVAGGSPLISITASSSGTFRFAGFTIRGGNGAIKEGGMVAFRGSSRQARIDHITIDKSTYSRQNSGKFMVIGGMLRGVIDNIVLNAGSDISWIHFVNGEDAGHGDTTWSQPTGFGTSDFMFVEDSHLIARRSSNLPPRAVFSDCHTGGKFVIRYSTTLNGAVGQTHPTGHAGDDRGCRGFELYGITATNDHGGQEQSFVFSYNNSGPQITWGNDLGRGTYKNILYFNICRTGSACGYNPPYGGWGVCGAGSSWDQNNGAGGYACIDQPGRGQGDLLTGSFPNKTNPSRGGPLWPRQAIEPMYEWSTTGTIGAGWGGAWVSNNSPTQIQQNRDYFLHHNNSGCNPGAATCATGVGVGPIAQRPTNCALNTAWWATDQGGDWHKRNATSNDGALFRCTAQNTWTLHYTPYTYPHPLRQTSESALPMAPSGVRAE